MASQRLGHLFISFRLIPPATITMCSLTLSRLDGNALIDYHPKRGWS